MRILRPIHLTLVAHLLQMCATGVSSSGLPKFGHVLHHTDMASRAADAIISQQRNHKHSNKQRKRRKKKKKVEEGEFESDGEVSGDELPITWDEEDEAYSDDAESVLSHTFGDSEYECGAGHDIIDRDYLEWNAGLEEQAPLALPRRGLSEKNRRRRRRKRRKRGRELDIAAAESDNDAIAAIIREAERDQ